MPTLAESVAPGFDIDSWQGVLAPARTPVAVVDRLHAALAAALRDPAVEERLTGLGFAITALGPAEFRARAHAASEAFAPIVRSFGA